jgi:DNA mismatch repair protein MutS
MSGKSTYLRQNALIVLLAHIGMFVPALDAEIGLVDRIFTRIGTSDNISRGQSTFLVEMMETAHILKNATSKSLIIMDEIGRGTSTYDGLAIAWSILEFIQNKKYLGAKTLFATHYHELVQLENKDGIENLSVSVDESGDRITFLHKIRKGAAAKSYGIHVAQLAQMPEAVTRYAQILLENFEKKQSSHSESVHSIPVTGQLELFDFEEDKKNRIGQKILDQIRFTNLDQITPVQALIILNDFQKKLKK